MLPDVNGIISGNSDSLGKQSNAADFIKESAH